MDDMVLAQRSNLFCPFSAFSVQESGVISCWFWEGVWVLGESQGVGEVVEGGFAGGGEWWVVGDGRGGGRGGVKGAASKPHWAMGPRGGSARVFFWWGLGFWDG